MDAAGKGGTASGEVSIRCSDGASELFTLRLNAVTDSGGQATGFEGVLESRNSDSDSVAEQYRSFLEDDLAGHFVSQADGKIIACNPAFARIFGFDSVDEALNMDAIAYYINSKDRVEFLQLLQRRKKLANHEMHMRRRDGKLLHILENVSATFDERGEIALLRGFIIDNTERRQLEEQLRQSQKMEGLGTLAGGIAHDFNNILAIINGYARLARQEGSNSTRLGEWMDAIGKSVERGAGVVAQLMAFARKTKGEPAPFRVNAILQEILPLMAETFPKNIVFDAQLQPGLPLVEGDSSQLHQVFLNLFLNSRDAMPAGGTISIETSSMKAEKLRGMMYNPKDPDYVCILIRDNGIGMDEKTKSRIFEPFFTTKEIGKGSGLGLAVVYGVVTSHRGFIDVKSEPGKGTSFSIYLPSVPPTAKASTKSPAVPAVRSGNETILLVEDEEMLLDLLQIMIESNGYKVLTASNGEDAVKLYEQKKESIALVLSDMGLPKLGGWEAFQRMKQINPDVKAILASGYLDPHLKSEMLKGGARDFIQKPYVPEQILRRIREIIDGG